MFKPEIGGAVRCWCSPAGGWSRVVGARRSTVIVLDAWNGGAAFRREIPREAVREVMGAGEVALAARSGRLQALGASGFRILDPP